MGVLRNGLVALRSEIRTGGRRGREDASLLLGALRVPVHLSFRSPPPALPLQMCRRPPREKTVLVGRRAVLEVTVSRSGGHVCWLREGVELCPGDKYELRSHGPTHSLVIHDVRPEDQGTYCCQAGQDSAHTQLLVEGE